MLSTKKNKAAGYTADNKIKLIHGGKEYFDTLLTLFDKAAFSIHLQTYIFEEDETGRLVADALIKAATKGIKVFVLVDGYASQGLSKHFVQQLKQSGIFFRWFEPVLRSRHFYFGRRLHHKVVVADGYYSLVGGINISNRYNDMPNENAWMDWALYSEGEVNKKLYQVCRALWNKSGWGKKRNFPSVSTIDTSTENECLVAIRRNDWVRGKNEITKSYVRTIREAQSNVIIMSSYFLPGRLIKRSLALAAKRKVKVVVIATGKSDVTLAKHAERHIYRWLLKNGIELYEYRSNILHSKLSVCDGEWITVGSYNVNNISAYASVELNMDVLDSEFVKEAEKMLQAIIAADCERITEADFIRHNNFIKRIWQQICYNLVRVIFYLFTFYFKQERQ
ncbi:phospholipase D-like domain-containing protein [Ferruginibacter albus]|uniref:phospholipase D-like domain-containing protein n=1 Tax=Ferruginibacter albus TaxID=2875540 RepID=UPI001CC6BBBA|nr:phospholipase D-like domain-containing protein [Ferruginibacter albus]UAY51559.1 phospholipase [Ferruginibacter albus]